MASVVAATPTQSTCPVTEAPSLDVAAGQLCVASARQEGGKDPLKLDDK